MRSALIFIIAQLLKYDMASLSNDPFSVKTIERELKSIADDQGANATELVELVKENEKIVQAIQVSSLLMKEIYTRSCI